MLGWWKKRAKSAESAEKRVCENDVLMSSDEDVPAPCPSATVLARRASREVKPMREESSSDEDAEEPEEWEGADETSCSEEEGEEVERVSNAQRGCVRLHGVVQSSAGLKGHRGVGKGRKINNRTHLSVLMLPTHLCFLRKQTDRIIVSYYTPVCLPRAKQSCPG